MQGDIDRRVYGSFLETESDSLAQLLHGAGSCMQGDIDRRVYGSFLETARAIRAQRGIKGAPPSSYPLSPPSRTACHGPRYFYAGFYNGYVPRAMMVVAAFQIFNEVLLAEFVLAPSYCCCSFSTAVTMKSQVKLRCAPIFFGEKLRQ